MNVYFTIEREKEKKASSRHSVLRNGLEENNNCEQFHCEMKEIEKRGRKKSRVRDEGDERRAKSEEKNVTK